MRSRPARLTLSALAWTALGAAAFLTFQTQQQVGQRRASLRTFEATARDATDALGDMQAGQQAYVAVGQDPAEWAPKVAAHLQTAVSSIDALRASAASAAAGTSLLDSSSTLTELTAIDRRVREGLGAGGFQAAAALIFGEGAEAVGRAVSSVDTAVGAERQFADADESWLQRVTIYVLAGAAAISALALTLLGFASPVRRADDGHEAAETVSDEAGLSLGGAQSHLVASQLAPTTRPDALAPQAESAPVPTLSAAAALCTEFGRVREVADVKALLERAATAMNARGLIVWLGSHSGADLRPVLAFGYSDQTLARIPSVARSADNAAAAAYRTGEVQTVRSRPGASQGAIVAPLLSADGCIGALTAEIRDRGEETEAVRALASIVASQLAGVLAASATEPAADHQTGASSAAHSAAG